MNSTRNSIPLAQTGAPYALIHGTRGLFKPTPARGPHHARNPAPGGRLRTIRAPREHRRAPQGPPMPRRARGPVAGRVARAREPVPHRAGRPSRTAGTHAECLLFSHPLHYNESNTHNRSTPGASRPTPAASTRPAPTRPARPGPSRGRASSGSSPCSPRPRSSPHRRPSASPT